MHGVLLIMIKPTSQIFENVIIIDTHAALMYDFFFSNKKIHLKIAEIIKKRKERHLDTYIIFQVGSS